MAAAAAEGYFLFVFLFKGGRRGVRGSNGCEECKDSLASFFLAGDQSNGLNGGRGRGSDKEVRGGRQEGGASVVAGHAPFISPVGSKGEFGGNCESQRRFGRKAFGPGLEGHSSGEWMFFWTTHRCLADGTRQSASAWCGDGIFLTSGIVIFF